MIGEALGRGADPAATHVDAGSPWMVLSMIASSLFLLAFAWELVRSTKQASPTPADLVTDMSSRRLQA